MGQQFALELAELAAWRAHQVLPAAPAQQGQVLFADDAAIEHPHPPRTSVLALHQPHHRFQRGHVGAVALEDLVAERKALRVHDQRNHQLFAVGPVIARVAALHHRVVFRRALHIAAGQVVEQHIELRREQLPIALLEMPLQRSLVGQQAVQATI